MCFHWSFVWTHCTLVLIICAYRMVFVFLRTFFFMWLNCIHGKINKTQHLFVTYEYNGLSVCNEKVLCFIYFSMNKSVDAYMYILSALETKYGGNTAQLQGMFLLASCTWLKRLTPATAATGFTHLKSMKNGNIFLYIGSTHTFWECMGFTIPNWKITKLMTKCWMCGFLYGLHDL